MNGPSEHADTMFMQIVAALVVLFVVLATAALSFKYPAQASIGGTLASALIAKWFGRPLTRVMLDHVASLPPPLAAEVARRAIASLPPEARKQLEPASVVLTGLTDPPPGAPPPDGR